MTNLLKEILYGCRQTLVKINEFLGTCKNDGTLVLIKDKKEQTRKYGDGVIECHYTDDCSLLHELGHAACMSFFTDEELKELYEYGLETMPSGIDALPYLLKIQDFAKNEKVNNFLGLTIIDIAVILKLVNPVTRPEEVDKLDDPIWAFNELFANFYVVQNYFASDDATTIEKTAIRYLKHIMGANFYNMFRSFISVKPIDDKEENEE